MTPTVWLAALAGAFSFLSPCVLPLVPSYLSVVAGPEATSSRRATLWNALGFVIGFSIVFVVLGASLGLLGGLLKAYRLEVAWASGALIVLFGLHMLGLLRLPSIGGGWTGLRPERLGLAGPVALGAAFGTGWTPCIGPVLGAILTLAASEGSPGQGVALLGAYSAGLALPFLATALAAGPVLGWARRHRQAHLAFERVAGALLVVMGLLVATNTMARLNAILIQMTPDWLWSRL